ncbi:hypothetical protein GCM10010302_75400 [Streptomyces polychromogenes]|uniref:Uncharacterized protein n=1 Tax=Streptomyces polychromogenes TaxID=67342 RepID=A0ABN0W4X6_9ACTN
MFDDLDPQCDHGYHFDDDVHRQAKGGIPGSGPAFGQSNGGHFGEECSQANIGTGSRLMAPSRGGATLVRM